MKYSVVLIALLGTAAAKHHHHHHQAPVSYAQGDDAKDKWNPAKSRETFEKHVAEAA